MTCLDVCRMKEALNGVCMRNAILRSVYTATSQIALSGTESYLCLHSDDVVCNIQNDFDISKESSIKILMNKLDENVHRCVLIFHHIAVDGISIGIIVNELSKLYEGQTLPRPSLQYADYAASLTSNLKESSLKYWKRRLANMSRELPPTDKPRPSQQTYNGSTVEVSMNATLHSSLRELCARLAVTPFSVLVAAYKYLIYKIATLPDHIIGFPVANRDVQTRSMVGCFVNTLVLRSQVESTSSIAEYVKQIHNDILEAQAHGDVPFDSLVNTIEYDRDLSTSPLFQVMLVMDTVTTTSSTSSLIRSRSVATTRSKYEQTWYFVQHEKGITVKVEYNTDLFYKETINDQIQRLFYVIHLLASNPKKQLIELSIARSIELLEISEENAQNERDIPWRKTVLEIIGEQRKRRTGRIQMGSESMSYTNLEKQSNKLARTLIQEYVQFYGEVPTSDRAVCVYLSKSLSLLSLALAVWKCGMMLVPMSLDWPRERQRTTLAALHNPLLVTEAEHFDEFPCVSLSKLLQNDEHLSDMIPIQLHARSLLYITCTSGTSGLPKMVCTEAIGHSNLAINYTRTFHISNDSDVVNYAFDIFFSDTVECFVNGASLRVAAGSVPNIREMENVTQAYLMPAFMSSLPDTDAVKLARLDTIQFGGEAIQPNTFGRLLSAGVPLNQGWGVTEQTVYSSNTVSHVGDKRGYAGRPFYNIGTYTIDADQQVLPSRYAGVICATGSGISRGYYSQDDMNIQKYRQDEIASKDYVIRTQNKNMFDTNDVLKKEGNQFMFIGRTDFQVKIRGRRIELLEVQHHITKLTFVDSCVVGVHKHKNEPELIAHIKFLKKKENNIEKLKSSLSSQLPEYMIPYFIIQVDDFVLNANGKVDRSKLPLPEYTSPNYEKMKRLPETKIENTICDIFKRHLDCEVHATDCFFELGGNSIRAMLAVQEMEDHGIIVPLRELFRMRTPELIAEYIEQEKSLLKENAPGKLIRRAHPNEDYFSVDASSQQKRIWFLQQMDETDTSYIIPLKIHMQGTLNEKTFISAFHSVLMQSSGYRLNFFVDEYNLMIIPVSGTESYFHLSNDDESELHLTENALPIRAQLKGEDNKTLVLKFHHIIVDGVSLAITAKQLVESYNNTLSNYYPEVKQEYSYFDYCRLRENNCEKLEFWKTYLEKRDAKEYPTDQPRAIRLQKKGAHIKDSLELLNKNMVDEACRRHGCSPFHLLAAALAITIQEKVGTDVTFGTPIANRDQKTMNVPGLFVNTIPVRINKMHDNVDTFMAHVVDSVCSAQSHSCPLDEIVRAVDEERSAGRSPLTQWLLNWQSMSLADMPHMGELRVSLEWPQQGNASEQSWIISKDMHLDIEYDASLYKEETVLNELVTFKNALYRLVHGNYPENRFTSHRTQSPVKETKDIEDVILSIWRRHLRASRITIHSNFFHSGGHSLLIPAIVKDIKTELGVKVPIVNMFHYQTVRELVTTFVNESQDVVLSTKQTQYWPLKASKLQEHLLKVLSQHKHPDLLEAYNICISIKLRRSIPIRTIVHLINTIVMHHSALRTFFAKIREGFMQTVCSGTEAYLSILQPTPNQFEIFDSPPIAISLMQSTLTLTMNHLITDGHSAAIIATQLQDLLDGKELVHSQQYYNFTQTVNEKFNEKDKEYWKSQLSEYVFNPLQTTKLHHTSFKGSAVEETIAIDFVTMLSQRFSCSPFVVLLATLGDTVRRNSVNPQAATTIAYPFNTRGEDMQDVVGFGVNTLVAVMDPLSNAKEYIDNVNRQVTEGIGHSYISTKHLLEMTKSNKIFDVMLTMDSYTFSTKDFELMANETRWAKFPISAFARHDERNMNLKLEYMTDTFSKEEAITILKQWIGTIEHWSKSNQIKTSNGRRNFVIENGVYCKQRTDQPLEVDIAAEEDTDPSTITEFLVLKTVRSLLQSKRIRIIDNFFHFGGNSLNAERAARQITSATGKACTSEMIYNGSTFRELSRMIDHGETKEKLPLTSMIVMENRQPLRGYPLSPQQLQMYFLHHSDPSFHYNLPFMHYFSADLSIPAISQAFHYLVQSQPSLRTIFTEEDDEPVQIVLSATECYFHSKVVKTADVEEAIREMQRQPFNLSAYPPVSIQLFSTVNGYTLSMILHHIISDARSTEIFEEQISQLYNEIVEGKTPRNVISTYTYIDYANKMQDVDEMLLKETTSRLATTLPPMITLIFSSHSDNDSIFTFDLSSVLVTAVYQIATKNSTTIFTIILTALQRTIFNFTGQSHISIGAPFANRNDDTNYIIGYFLNNLVFTFEQSGNINEAIRKTKAEVLRAMRENVPYGRLVSNVRSKLKNNAALYEVYVNCRYGMESGESISHRHALPMGPVDLQRETMHPIELDIDTHSEGIRMTLRFSRKTASREDAGLFKAKLIDSLEEICGIDKRNEETSNKLEIMNEYEQLLLENTLYEECDYPQIILRRIFQTQAKLCSYNKCIIRNGSSTSYNDLEASILSAASIIQQEYFCATGETIKPDTMIAVVMEKSEDATLACMAVIHSGAAYVPIDIHSPLERIKFQLEECGAQVYISSAELEVKQSFICVRSLNQTTKCLTWNSSHSSDLAYVIYTSGTTGKPKGVCAVQGAVANMVAGSTRQFYVHHTDCVYQFTHFVFDNSVLEVWMALGNGASLFCDRERFTSERFVQTMTEQPVTHALLFPGLVSTFSEEEFEQLTRLRYWIVGAEKAPAHLIEAGIKLGVNIIQNYGPTETTAYALYKHIRRGDHPNNLGRPIQNARIWNRLDGNPAAFYSVGELHISGVGLMRGYVNGKESFTVTRDLKEYASGDMVHQTPNGDIIIHGRSDGQVKIRGFRVELGEIEQVILKMEGVKQVKVTFDEERLTIAAYYTGTEIVMNTMRKHCNTLLLGYMIPHFFMHMTEFPLTANTKIDISKLPQPDDVLDDDDNDNTMKNIEPISARLMDIWKELLRNDNIELSSNFMFIGGNSLMLLKLRRRLNREFNTDFDITILLKHTVFESMCELVRRSKEKNVVKEILNVVSVDPTSRILIVFFHPLVGGGYFPYQHVIGKLKSLAVDILTVQHPNTFKLSTNEDVFTQGAINNLAEEYYHHLKKHLKQKVVLVGASLGGLIALEVAKYVNAEIIMIDTGSQPHKQRHLSQSEHASQMSDILAGYGEYIDETTRKQMVENSWQLLQASYTHNPKHHGGKVHLLSVDETDLGWSSIVNISSLHSIDGTHATMLDETHASHIATLIRDIL